MMSALLYLRRYNIKFYIFIIFLQFQYLLQIVNAKKLSTEIYIAVAKRSTLSASEINLKNKSIDSQDPFELDDDGGLVKPEMLISDWIEMYMLGTLLVIGFPLNAFTLTRLLHTWYMGRSNLYRTKVFYKNKKILIKQK